MFDVKEKVFGISKDQLSKLDSINARPYREAKLNAVEQEKVKAEGKIDERVLEDTFPVMGSYLYLCDGKVFQSLYNTSVGDVKSRLGVKEMRRCDIGSRTEGFTKRILIEMQG